MSSVAASPTKDPHARPVTAASGPAHSSFQADAARVLGELHLAISSLLSAASAPTSSCAEVEDAFGIDAMLAWQILRIARVADPFAAGIKVPARVSMQKLLKAAAKRRAPESTVARVSAAFADFETLVAKHAGSRAEFELLLGPYLPEVREKQDLAAKESAYRGNAHIHGYTLDLSITARFLHPSSTGERDDSALLHAQLGLRRLRQNAHMEFWSGDFTGSRQAMITLDRTHPDRPHDFFLKEFCSSPLPSIESTEWSDEACFFLAGDEVGLRSAADIVTADYRPNSARRFAQPGIKYLGVAHQCEGAIKRLVQDVFVHKNLLAGAFPELRIYQTGIRGLVTTFDDPKRQRDRLWMHESVTQIEGGLPHARIPHTPRYQDMLQHVCAKLGWNPSEFRGYRVDVMYPVCSAVYNLGFLLPHAPGSAI